MIPSPHLLRHYGLRATGLSRTWTIRKSVTDPATGREHQIKRSTHTTDPALAIEIARTLIDPFLSTRGHRRPAVTSLTTEAGTPYDQLCALYLTTAACALATRRKNLSCLSGLIAEALPGVASPDLTAIDGRLARQWLLNRRQYAELAHLPFAAESCETAKRGANAIYRQARSVFSRRQLAAYADHGITLPPTLRTFAEQPLLEAAPPPPCQSLTPEQQRALAAELDYARLADPATYAATLLMSLGGLRNSEALHATWAMLSPGESGTWLLHLYAHGAYKPKAASRTIILAATVVEALRAVRRDQAPEAHLVTAHHATARHTACYRSISTLLRRAGIAPVKGKLAYRLRAHAITQIILNHGMDAAQQFAGHTTAKTTAIYKGASIPYQPLPL